MIRCLLLLALLPPGPVLAAARVDPGVAERVLELLEQAEEAPEESLEKLAGLARRAKTDADLAFVLTERAALLIQRDELDLARQEMAEALNGRPEEFAPRLRNLYATTLLVAEDYEGALHQLRLWDAHAETPHPGGLFLMGYAFVRLERFAEAVPVLERCVRSDYPVRDQWVELLAYAYTRTGRTADAVRLLEGLIAEHPDRSRWWKQLAGIFMLLDRVPTGTASLAVPVELDGLTFAEKRRLARLFAHLDMPADGAELLAAAMGSEGAAPDYEDQMLLGELWMLAREFDHAVAAFHAAQALADHGEPAMLIGQLHAQREEYGLAREALGMAVAAYGEEAPPQLHYLLAVIEINLGNLQAASASVARLAADEKYRERGENLAVFIRASMGNSTVAAQED